MRIISGKHKGRRLEAPKKLPVRPTTDMAKEGLFNILSNRFDFFETSVLDLFSGTGNMSYEFASRGVPQITAVDKNYHCVQYISKTSTILDAGINVVKSDVFQYLEKTSLTADLIFADPPYDFPLEKFQKIVDIVLEKNLLNPDGVLVIEHSKHTDLSKTTGFDEKRNYGNSVFSFFKN
ncbi:MAG TPA: RsmD family RNA methyltransferase [Flavobacteriaceae bacterium]|nr:RsmD family RNA methyltransferase [Flavobacteriaceae bacterium]